MMDYIISGPPEDMCETTIRSTGERLLESLQKHSDKIAQIDSETDQSDTFGEILQKSISTAIHLRKRGIKPQDIISICSSNNLNNGVTFLAAQFIGAIPANLDPTLSLKETVYLLNLVKPKLLFVSEEAVKLIEEAIRICKFNAEMVVLGQSNKYIEFNEFLRETDEEKYFKVTPISRVTDSAAILFTSGTSGFPKAVCLNHYSFTKAHIQNLDNEVTKNEGSLQAPVIYMSYATLYWISSVRILLASITSGICRLLCGEFHPEKTLQLIEKYGVRFLFISPTQAVELYNLKRQNFIKFALNILIGGAVFSANQMIKMREMFPEATIYQAYGQTELSGGVTTFDDLDNNHLRFIKEKPGSCGMVIAGVSLKIVDPETEQILGPNCPGELRVKTKYGMNGYYNSNSSNVYDSDGWIKTGDILYYDEDRCFYVVDKIKEAFKYKGWHVQPAVLEAELLQHPAVKLALVFGIPNEADGEHPAGIVVLYYKNNATSDEIQKFANSRLSERQQLRGGVTIVDSLPMTPTGKIKRSKIKKLLLNDQLQSLCSS